ncbi:uncharacterized protein METZ01_LOCUS372497, partial [marine metagenome]
APSIDEALMAGLTEGLPGCAGGALGLDRALMIDEGVDDIHQVIAFTPSLNHDA